MVVIVSSLQTLSPRTKLETSHLTMDQSDNSLYVVLRTLRYPSSTTLCGLAILVSFPSATVWGVLETCLTSNS